MTTPAHFLGSYLLSESSASNKAQVTKLKYKRDSKGKIQQHSFYDYEYPSPVFIIAICLIKWGKAEGRFIGACANISDLRS